MIRAVPVFSVLLSLACLVQGEEETPPNIVYIMTDELAYFELGHMGNPYLKTPRIDRMAQEGIRFTNAMAASPVCAPLRGCLMTGKHSGHASVRANDGGTPLRSGEITIASMLKQKDYATGGFGKWGAGGRGSTGVPEKHGFDVFFGYYDQVHAHSFYPPYLVRNSEEVALKGNEGGRSGESYSHYAIMDEGLDFIRENHDRPFFAYFPITPPHGMYDIPRDDPAWEQYEGEEWMNDPTVPQDARNYAAMVTMVDNNLGTILDLLEELEIADNTIVFFTGDNGGQDRFPSEAHPRGFFGPNVNPVNGQEFRGGKGNLYEGGLKIPFLVRWPGHIEEGRVSDFLFVQYDIMATLADLTGTEAPDDNDGISIMPEILGDSENQEKHEMFYWEFREQVAVRFGKWKAILPGKNKEWELYDLETDVSETVNLASDHADVLKRMQAFAESSHTPAEPGTYDDPARELHERDRRAKWGTTRSDDKSKRTSNRIKAPDLLSHEDMSLVRYSSENYLNDRMAEYAIDGKIHTVWHSRFSKDLASHPHELVIDLGEERVVSAIHYLPRQDASWNGVFGETEFYLSGDADDFAGDPVASVSFGKDRKAQTARLDNAEKGRFLLVRSLSEINGRAFASAAEIGVSVIENNETVDLLSLESWKGTDSWNMASGIEGSTEKKEWSLIEPGEGILYYRAKGSNLTSRITHGDCRLEVEFMIPKGSNSGIYFQERYEVQILDSFGKPEAKLANWDNGGIYQRWNDKAEKGKEAFEGTAPSSNQSKAPGEWQSFEITFRAPRFDEDGKKVGNARFVSVVHNGIEIHRDIEVTGPTRGGISGPEAKLAPLKIQGDHGPVAFRKLRIYNEETFSLEEELAESIERRSGQLEAFATSLLRETDLDRGRRVQLLSMAMAAYRANQLDSLWSGSIDAGEMLRSFAALLTDHGFDRAELSFERPGAEEESSTTSVVPIEDLIITLALGELCLRLKQGPESVAEWPNWTPGDVPLVTRSSEHYDRITERFKIAALTSPGPIDVALDFIPRNWVYQRLIEAIARQEEAPDPPQLVVEGLIKVGDEYGQLDELADFLIGEGFLSEEERGEPDGIYNEAVSGAVRAWQKENGLLSDGILGPKTAEGLSKKKDRKDQLVLNLHRARRLPDDLGEKYLLANLPAGEVYGMENDEETLRMRVVFGKDVVGQRTPLFRDRMEHIVFRPYWNVPYSIATGEGNYSDLSYLSSKGFEIISSRTGATLPLTTASLNQVYERNAYLRQDGGTGNALGLVKFLFPNKHSVYFHDTPSKHLFESDYRAHSHGCVRLQKPEAMANWLLKDYESWTPGKIRYAINDGEREDVFLETKIPVYIVYFTAFPDPSKESGVGFFRDYYDYDEPGAIVDVPAPPRPKPELSTSDSEGTGLFRGFFNRSGRSPGSRGGNRKGTPLFERFRSRP